MTTSTGWMLPRPRLVRWLTMVAAAWVLAVPMVFTASPTACACSCVSMSVRDQVERADLVAVGEIRRVSKRSEPWEYVSRHLVVEVALTRVHKGPTDSLVSVRTADGGPSCGIEPAVGQQILLFARAGDGGWGTNICDGTGVRTTDRMAQVVQLTGPGSAVTPPPASGPASGILRSWGPLAVAAIVLGLAGVAATLMRRRG